VIVVCWKWVAGDGDERWAGVSEPDRTALEVGLRLAEVSSDTVTVVSVGGPGAVSGLREALAAGASRAVRVDAPPGLTSPTVAGAIAPVAASAGWVVCGDASADRGSGSVPAFLAAELGVAQALGLVAVTTGMTGVRAVRRLDGGRREILDVAPPAVISVEGSVARLRRATLVAELAARTAPVDEVDGPIGPVETTESVRPYRPRARAIAAPSGDALDRVRRLTDVGGQRTAHELISLDPPAAAKRILAALRDWGYR
jgi:electron transfer flavoprotein beta subunit